MEPESPLASSKGQTMDRSVAPTAGARLSAAEVAHLVAVSELTEAAAAERTAGDTGYPERVRTHLTARSAELRARAARRQEDAAPG